MSLPQIPLTHWCVSEMSLVVRIAYRATAVLALLAESIPSFPRSLDRSVLSTANSAFGSLYGLYLKLKK